MKASPATMPCISPPHFLPPHNHIPIHPPADLAFPPSSRVWILILPSIAPVCRDIQDLYLSEVDPGTGQVEHLRQAMREDILRQLQQAGSMEALQQARQAAERTAKQRLEAELAGGSVLLAAHGLRLPCCPWSSCGLGQPVAHQSVWHYPLVWLYSIGKQTIGTVLSDAGALLERMMLSHAASSGAVC